LVAYLIYYTPAQEALYTVLFVAFAVAFWWGMIRVSKRLRRGLNSATGWHVPDPMERSMKNPMRERASDPGSRRL